MLFRSGSPQKSSPSLPIRDWNERGRWDASVSHMANKRKEEVGGVRDGEGTARSQTRAVNHLGFPLESSLRECHQLRRSWLCRAGARDGAEEMRRSGREGSPPKATPSRGDVVDLAEWLMQKFQADLEHRTKDGDGVERLRANRAIVALRRMLRRIERSVRRDNQ